MEQYELKQRQSLSLESKIELSKRRIRTWYEHWQGNVYVSFSGGKDSTVLLHLVRSIYPEVPAYFVDTGLEYPEIREFVKSTPNVNWLRPKMSFVQVIDKYGYPIISKDVACSISRYRNTKSDQQKYYRLHGFPNGKKGMIPKKWQYLIDAPFKIGEQCCDIIKKNPLKKIKSYPFIGTMATDSNRRQQMILKNGCNSFELKSPISMPLSFWNEQNIWEYIHKFNVPYCKIYDTGVKRTGCMFCMFGLTREKEPNRFNLMKETHPQLYDYCMNKLKIKEVLNFINKGREKGEQE